MMDLTCSKKNFLNFNGKLIYFILLDSPYLKINIKKIAKLSYYLEMQESFMDSFFELLLQLIVDFR